MDVTVTVFYDYTCAHSYRLHEVLRRMPPEKRPDVAWMTLSLKEFKRNPREPSAFADGLGGFSILALALAHAVRDLNFAPYHDRLFDAVHAEHRGLTRADLLALAAQAGLDVPAFEAESGRWLAAVAEEHRQGVERWRAHGTPTVVLGGATAVYVRFSGPPDGPARADRIWAAIAEAALGTPELFELKRSV